jgi:hypothetical protein
VAMDAATDFDKPGIEEQYEAATNTSNLKQEPERRTSADILRDMAMSASRIGAALLRLRAQWESSTRPDRRQARSVKEFEKILNDRQKAIDAHHAEKLDCDSSYERALTALANRLTDLESVRTELLPVAMKRRWGVPVDPVTRAERAEQHDLDDAMLERLRGEVTAAPDAAAETAAQASLNHWVIAVAAQRAEEEREDRERARVKIGQVIRYWLDQTCPKCAGTRWQLVPGTNRQSTKVCPPVRQGGCGGSGFIEVPHGQEGRWLANHMDQCVHRYRQKLNTRRKAFRSIPPIDRLSKRMQPDPSADQD